MIVWYCLYACIWIMTPCSGRPTDQYPMVYILSEGYIRASSSDSSPDAVRMSGTVALVKMDNKSILVDTGASNRALALSQTLSAYGLAPSNISLLILTHTHPDHYQSALMFYPAKQIINNQLINRDEFMDNPLKSSDSFSPLGLDELILMSTPGHSSSDITLLVHNFNNTGKKLAIVGDLFIDSQDYNQDTHGNPLWMRRSEHPYAQKRNRKLIGCQVDYIIPGHGPIFMVTAEMRDILDCSSAQILVNPPQENVIFIRDEKHGNLTCALTQSSDRIRAGPFLIIAILTYIMQFYS